MSLERRQEERLKPPGRTLVRLDGVADSLFHIVDISTGGCAFRYLGSDKLEKDAGTVDIVCGDEVSLIQIPFQAVSDCEIDYGFIPMRRRGVRFDALTESQKADIEQLLLQCAPAVH